MQIYTVLKTLGHPLRFGIYELLLTRRCISVSDVMRILNVKGLKRLRYHLEVLKKGKLIEEKRVRFRLTQRNKSKAYLYLNVMLQAALVDLEAPVLDIPLTMDESTDFIDKFERQLREGIIPEEVANEISQKVNRIRRLRIQKERIAQFWQE